MATKAEEFKAETERAARARRAPGGDHLSAGVRAARRGRRKDRLPNPTSHNEAPRAKRRAKRNTPYELEPSSTARPSRKSSRRSPSHVKTDSPLRIATMLRNGSAEARAARKTGNPN
jgi:hypothetical protein